MCDKNHCKEIHETRNAASCCCRVDRTVFSVEGRSRDLADEPVCGFRTRKGDEQTGCIGPLQKTETLGSNRRGVRLIFCPNRAVRLERKWR